MCTQQRWIRNKYDGTKHFVKCGHCPACLQEKSLVRKNRIDSEFNSGRECVFATLSYADPYIPYVYKDDAIKFLKSRAYNLHDDVSHETGLEYKPTLNIYRDFHAQQSNHGLVVKKLNDPIKTLEYSDFTFHGKNYCPDWKGLKKFNNMHYERHGRDFFHHDKIAVLNFDDIKKFYKKLREYLKYRGYEERYEIFYCGEYGGDFARPHYHLLISIPQGHYELFKTAVLACWSYANHDVLDREIELASDPSSYLASYVNSGENIPSFLSDSPSFRPRHKYSHGFGMSLGKFSYQAVQDAVNRGTLEYDVYTTSHGVSSWRSVPIPKYVVNRYFPVWKGHSRLTSNEVFDVLQRPYNIAKYREKCSLDWKDCNNIVRKLRNFRKRFEKYDPNNDWYSYICTYISAHNLHYVTCFKHAYKEVQMMHDWKYFYYNIPDLIRDSVFQTDFHYTNYRLYQIAPTLSNLDFTNYEFDPNYWPSNLRKHNKMITAWKLYCKNREIKSELYKIA